jgi:4-hydroxy-tetrahydrodipicolinate synthase
MFQHGLYTALVTPFAENGTSIDMAAFEKLLSLQLEANVAGIVLFGSTGESPTVTLEEREWMLSLAIKNAGSKITLMAGISTNDIQTALTLARQAKRLGAHGLQIASPSYNRPTQEGLYQFYKTIGESVDIPIFPYNIPSRTSVHIEKATTKRLFDLSFIQGVKEASGSLITLFDVLETASKASRKLLILEGDDMLAIPAIASGAHGIMSVISNLIPQTMKALVDGALKGDFEKSRALFFQIKPLIEACFLETNPTPIKHLLHLKGLLPDPCVRLPLVEPMKPVKDTLNLISSPFLTWK